MNKYFKIILFLLIFCSTIFAKPSDKIKFNSSEVTKLEFDFFTKIDKGQTNDIELHYDGFIIASGITDEDKFKLYKEKLNDIRNSAKSELSQYAGEGAYDFGKRLLLWIYEKGILKKYFETATLFQDMIYKGEYNCLTSSILYSLLYTEFGYKVKGILTSNHAFCMVYTDNGNIDVETTVAEGFDPGTKEIRNTGSSTIITFVPKQNYNKRNEVDILTLIATLYTNSISLRKIEKDLDKQIIMAKKAYYLSPHTEMYNDNLIRAFNRAALEHIKKAEYDEAYRHLEEALIFDNNNSRTKDTIIRYYNTIGLSYLGKKDFPNAIQIYKQGLKDIGKDAQVLENNLKVSYYNYIVSEYNSRRYNNAYIISQEALKIFPNDRAFLKLQTSIPK